MTEPVRFDRAAACYDRSRSLPDDTMARTVELLAEELRGRRPVLEVGVGTGLLALPLAEEGIELVGLDLSGPMLDKLVEKAEGRAPFPLVLADATRMPFPADAVGAAYLRWVLHLVPNWQGLLAEVARVVAPGGVFLALLGGYDPDNDAIRHRFGELTELSVDPVGLGWAAEDELDEAMARLGATARPGPSIAASFDRPLGEFLDSIEANSFSWTWPIPDDVRTEVLAELRAWTEEQYGPLDTPRHYEWSSDWRAYDLTG